MSAVKIAHAGSLLKARGYRSAALYLAAMKKQHIKQYAWTGQVSLEVKEAVASCDRGKGQAKQSGVIEL